MTTKGKNNLELILKEDSNLTAEAVRCTLHGIGRNSGRSVTLSIIFGDLTQVKMDAIVCPSNGAFELAMGGVQNAIAAAAGKETFEDAQRKKKGWMGDAIATTGYAIAAKPGMLTHLKGIIHVNSMRLEMPPCDADVVKSATIGSLLAAQDKGYESVAFPAIGTGVWGMPYSESLSGMITGIRLSLGGSEKTSVKRVGIVIYEEATVQNASQMFGFMQGILRR